MTEVELDEEFRAAFRRAGLPLPIDRYELMLEGYRSYRELAEILREPLHHGVEPAGLYLPASDEASVDLD